ncbi:hypothetical protein BGZ61DRAFT_445100, partial [Ilyonectria robusta]|uniref:uncharacterized protein n=1 Tax=Ilyonectria robusta TaxID=1079257 RepID=UPI001E8E4DD3
MPLTPFPSLVLSSPRPGPHSRSRLPPYVAIHVTATRRPPTIREGEGKKGPQVQTSPLTVRLCSSRVGSMPASSRSGWACGSFVGQANREREVSKG